ncbi:unnamed protein product [Calypogeia fissa]
MSIPHMELFYEGYDPTWVLGRDKGPPVETKPKPPAPKEEKKPPAPIELKVPFCCEGCQDRIQSALIELEGVDSVKLDPDSEKVTITGKVKPEDALKEAKRVVKRSEMWPKKKEEGKKDEKKDDKKKD